MGTAWEAMPFGWPTYVIPFLFVYSPTLILKGDLIAIALAAVTAAAGVWLISVAVVGYFVRRLGPIQRGLFAVAGAGLLMPASAFDGALYTDIGGAILAAITLISEIVAVRTSQAAAQP